MRPMTRLAHCFKPKPVRHFHFSCAGSDRSCPRLLLKKNHIALTRSIRFIVVSLLVSAGCAGPVEAQQPPPTPPPKQSLPAQPASGLHAVDVLMSLSSDMQTVAHSIEPAVVKIYATGLAPVENGDTSRTAFLAQQRSVGSGVIMDAAQGYILTKAHVVQHARTLSVLVSDMSGMVAAGEDRAEPLARTALSRRQPRCRLAS